jgi:UDP-N-acetylmuramoyl-L-alanyl-D-glutamate--2,6-diaminopimelate ligase
LDGLTCPPGVIPLVLPVLGVHQVANAALAAVVALLAGGSPTAVTESAAEQAPIRRRLEIVRQANPVVLDDTVGNPRAVEAVFETIRAIPHRALRIVFGIRGSRGPGINRRLAGALAAALQRANRPVQLVVTASEDTAGSRDRVRPEERDALLEVLRAEQVALVYQPTLAGAIGRAMAGVGEGDLVLLLGAQGMDAAAGITRSILESRS